MTVLKIYLFASCFLLFAKSSFAFEVEPTNNFQPISGKNIHFFIDKNREYTIDNVPFEKFKPNTRNAPNFGLFNGVVWLKIKLTGEAGQKRIFELKNPLLDSIEIYEKTAYGYKKSHSFGDCYVFSKRPIEHRFFQFHVSVPNEIVIRADNYGDLFVVPLNVSNEKGIKDRDYSEQFLWGAFFGLVIVFFSINLKLFLFGKVKSTFYYLIYLIMNVIVQLCFSGLGLQYFFPNSPEFVNRILPASGALTVFFILVFIHKFLDLKIYTKRLYRLFIAFEVTSILIAAMQFIPTQWAYIYGVLLTNAFVLLTCLIALAAAISARKRKFKPANYFTIGLLTQMIGAFLFISRNFGFLADNRITEYSLQISTGSFAWFLTLAIIQGFKDSKMEAIRNLKEIDALRESEGAKMGIEIKKQTQEIENQKEEIQQKNSEIFSSMSFAKQIQGHILPSQNDFKSNFESSFLLFYPKELLSGDFYWHLPLSNKNSFAFCIGDCTGHGVPGAMISVLALRFLSSAVLEEGLESSGDILNYVNKEFQNSFLKEESDSNINDGMDCVVCTFNQDTNILRYAGAKNDINIIRNEKILIYPGDRRSIGGATVRLQEDFTETEVQLMKGDCVYIYTDGYADQFGGPRQKKLKKQNVRNLIKEHHKKSMFDQGEVISNFFNAWKKNMEQTDDVCFFGFKVD